MLPTIGAGVAGGAGPGVWAGVGACALAPPITPSAITTSPSKSMRTTMSMAAPPTHATPSARSPEGLQLRDTPLARGYRLREIAPYPTHGNSARESGSFWL